MSDMFSKVEVITGVAAAPVSDGAEAGDRRRDDAARHVDQHVARRHGLSPSLGPGGG